MQRSVQEFQEAAIGHGIKKWVIHRCSMCGYPCGYIIGEGVMYDSGCDCTWSGPHQRTWEDLAEHYNRNQLERNAHITPEAVAEMDAFWHFDEVATG